MKKMKQRSALQWALNSCFLGMTALTSSFYASSSYAQAVQRDYQISANSLSRVLQQFARQSHLSLAYTPQQLAQLQSAGLSGRYSPEQALDILLAPHGFSAVKLNNGGFSIVKNTQSDKKNPQEILQLHPIHVTAQSEHPYSKEDGVHLLPTLSVSTNDDQSEGSNSYKAKSSRSATKLNLSLKQTPQSISVITHDQIEQRNLTDIDKILDATPGVTFIKLDTERSNYYARGHIISKTQIDGIPILVQAPSTDSIFFDRIEVVKGATGLMGSTGDPSATINMLRKRPAKTLTGNFSASYGTWNNLQQTADVSIPLNQDGSIRSRFIAAHRDQESFMDFYSKESLAAMAVLEADLGANTLVTLGFQYQDNNPKGSTWGTVPYWNADGSLANLPNNFSMAAKWNEISHKNKTTYFNIEHHFDNDWLIKAAINYSEASEYWITAYGGSGFPDPETGTGLGMWNGIWPYSTSDSLSYDLYAAGPWRLFGREHELVVGYSNFRETQFSDEVTADIRYPSNIPDYRTWDGNIPKATWYKNGAGSENRNQLSSSYATLKLNIADPFKLILGARYSDYEDKTYSWTATSNKTLNTSPTTTDRVTPFIGALYDINSNWSAYASYTDVFTPSSNKDRNDQYLDPELGSNYEIGIKAELLDKQLLLTTALFRSKIEDVAVVDQEYYDEYQQDIDNGLRDQAYKSTGEGLTIEGFEIEAIGKLSPNWNLTAGYTYVNSKTSVQAPTEATNIPEHQVKLYSNYTLSDKLWQGASRLTLGFGLTWQSGVQNEWGRAPENSVGDGVIYQDSYYLANATVNYQINNYLSANLVVNNLFNKAYYRNIGFYNGVYWGDPRNLMFTLRTKF